MEAPALKIEMDTTKCQELINEAKANFAEKLTLSHAMDYLMQNEEHIRWQLGVEVSEYKLAEMLYEYAQTFGSE